MDEITCPGCGDRTPADSRFCEMCGVELLECVNCGAAGTDPFCGECGGPMVSRKIRRDNAATVQRSDDDSDAHTTGRRRSPRLQYRKGNISITPENNAVIGRKEGPYADALSTLDLISRRHARFILRDGQWYIDDLNSTNGCYVNDREVRPGTPARFDRGDVVDIGTYLFDVL